MTDVNGNDVVEAGETPMQGLFKDIFGYLAGDSAREVLGQEPKAMPGFEVLLNMVTEALEASPMTIVPPRNAMSVSSEVLNTPTAARVSMIPQYSGHMSSSNTTFAPRHNFHTGSEVSFPQRVDTRPILRNASRGIPNSPPPPIDLTCGMDREIQGPLGYDFNSVLQRCKEQIDSLKDALSDDLIEQEPKDFSSARTIHNVRFSQFASPLDIGSMMACNMLDDFVGAGAAYRDVPESGFFQASRSSEQGCPSLSSFDSPAELSTVSSCEDFQECSTNDLAELI